MSVAARREPDEPGGARWDGAGWLDSGADAAQVLAAVNAVGQRRNRTAALDRAVDVAADVALQRPDAARVLPVLVELQGLLPWPGGIRRGATISVVGGTSLLLALLAKPMAAGSWAAIVGVPGFGVLAAAEYGIDVSRLALVPYPGEQWATVVAALIDGFDVVVVDGGAAVPVSTVRALKARARQKHCVLVSVQPWAECDLTLQVTQRRWLGLGAGRGRLRWQEVTVRSSGRGKAALDRQVSVSLPPEELAAGGRAAGEIPGVSRQRWLQQPVTHESPPARTPRRVVEQTVDPWRDLTARRPFHRGR